MFDKVLAVLSTIASYVVTALKEKDGTIADLQAQITDLKSQLATALSNDAADAETIATAQKEAADSKAAIEALNAEQAAATNDLVAQLSGFAEQIGAPTI